MNIAIIPARKGSKRIPHKNIKFFNGLPMISWSIKLALSSNLFDRVIVTTDCNEIADIALSSGAEIPFLRPNDLSDDFTTTLSVINHAILNTVIDRECNVCCLYPCSPFTLQSDLIKGLNLLKSNITKYIFPVTEYAHPIQRAMKIDSNNNLSFFESEFELSRTQDLISSYHDTGQFYWGTSKSWLAKNNIHSNGLALLLPKWRVIDIDTNEDWERAEFLYPYFLKNLKVKGNIYG